MQAQSCTCFARQGASRGRGLPFPGAVGGSKQARKDTSARDRWRQGAVRGRRHAVAEGRSAEPSEGRRRAGGRGRVGAPKQKRELASTSCRLRRRPPSSALRHTWAEPAGGEHMPPVSVHLSGRPAAREAHPGCWCTALPRRLPELHRPHGWRGWLPLCRAHPQAQTRCRPECAPSHAAELRSAALVKLGAHPHSRRPKRRTCEHVADAKVREDAQQEGGCLAGGAGPGDLARVGTPASPEPTVGWGGVGGVKQHRPSHGSIEPAQAASACRAQPFKRLTSTRLCWWR